MGRARTRIGIVVVSLLLFGAPGYARGLEGALENPQEAVRSKVKAFAPDVSRRDASADGLITWADPSSDVGAQSDGDTSAGISAAASTGTGAGE